MRLRHVFAFGTAGLAACASGNPPVVASPSTSPATAAMALTPAAAAFAFPDADTSAALHLLNRLTFGPRPGDIERVQRLGIARWLDQQLAPAGIPDTVQAAVRRQYALAFESPAELYRQFPPPNQQAVQAARRQAAQPGMMAPDSNGMQDPPPSGRPPVRQPGGVPPGRALGGQIVLATLTRHALSDRQLQEVMTDFWFNHFNVFIGKQADRWTTGDYVERAIRPNALGSFENLLKAVAHHPAMLTYLDNAQSVAPGSQPPGFGRRGAPPPDQVRRQMPTGLNENYARELLELHTLGVDGGYSQADVQNVARILSGWSIRGPGGAGGRRMQGNGGEPFTWEFHPWAHDRGEKTVLGEHFPAGHMEDEGDRLLAMLATHPSTARHLAHKLCARFVSDESPDGCVDHAVAAYLRSGGNIATTVRAIVSSEDFWAAANRRTKVKSPLEFVLSAMRVTGAAPDTTPRLAGVLQQLGQPLFQQQVPTGYPETQEDWVNSGALLSRMNIAMGLAAGRLPGTAVNLDAVVPLVTDRDELVARVNAAVLGGQASANTLRVLRQQIDDVNDARQARTMVVGLALGSPEFQRQ